MKIISKIDLNLGNFILTKNKIYDCELYNDHPQQQNVIRIVSISYKNDDGSHKETSIEKKVRIYLEKENIFFTQEYPLYHKGNTRYYDFLITDGLNYKILAECDGEYFHCKDLPYDKMTKLQKKNVRNDTLKNKIAKEKGIPLLRFTEGEIKTKFLEVQNKIQAEIERQIKKPE